jgi:hypothetical protein
VDRTVELLADALTGAAAAAVAVSLVSAQRSGTKSIPIGGDRASRPAREATQNDSAE